MRNTLPRLVLCMFCALTAGLAGAEQADRKQPMNIEADALRYDDLRQTSVFSGKVVVTRGSIIIRGARMEVRQDPQGYQFGVVTAEPGARAYFRQKRDGTDEYMEGESETIEYDGRADVFRLIGDAELRRLRGTRVDDRITGNLIVYNSLTDVFTVDGGGTPAVSGAAAPGGGRVRATLTPGSAPATPGPAVPLRPDDALGGGAR